MNRILAFLLVTVLCLGFAAPAALASEEPEVLDGADVGVLTEESDEPDTDEDTSGDECVVRIISDGEVLCDGAAGSDLSEFGTRAAALKAFHSNMINRNTDFSVKYEYVYGSKDRLTLSEYKVADATATADAMGIFTGMFDYDASSPAGGDYLYYHVKGFPEDGWKINITYVQYLEGGVETYSNHLYVTVQCQTVFYSTKQNETDVANRLNTVMNGLSLSGKSDYDKLCAIYTYVTNNVVYDEAHVNNDNYDVMYTAYGALIDGTAVCQGVCNLFYRMALTAGLNARIVGGTANNGTTSGGHAWCIVKLGSTWYNIDPTWDLGSKTIAECEYFLKGKQNFNRNHTRDNEYSGFDSLISSSDYVLPTVSGDLTGDGIVSVTDLVRLMTIISEGTKGSASASADVNGDKEIDLIDLVLIMKKLSENQKY